MTTPAVAGPAVGRDRQPRDRPFSVLDELNCYFDSPAERSSCSTVISVGLRAKR